MHGITYATARAIAKAGVGSTVPRVSILPR